MATDIFSRDTSVLGGVFTSDRAKLFFGSGLGIGQIVQQMQVSYSQSVTRLYEVGSNYIYYVGGRTQGQMAISRVIGPAGTMIAFYQTFGDVCNAKNNIINMQLAETDCSQGGATGTNNFDLANCVVTVVGFAVQSQDMMISESTTLMFSSLSVTVTGNGTVTAAPVGGAGTANSAFQTAAA
jgi:hypothetical protein